MKHFALAPLALASALAFGFAAWGVQAHEGHKHSEDTVAGTVVQVHEAATAAHIEVRTAKDETVVLTVDGATKYLKGKLAATLAEVNPGLRIVAKVTKDGAVMRASQINVGAMDPEAAQQDDQPRHGTTQGHGHEH